MNPGILMKSTIYLLVVASLLLANGTQQIRGQESLGPEQVVKLPGKATDIKPAGAGKYLLIKIDEVRKLLVFEVGTQRIIGSIPLSSEKVAVAGGLSKAVLADLRNGVIARWDIATQKRELVKSIDIEKPDDGQLLIGSGTNGPGILSVKLPIDRNSFIKGANYLVDLEELSTTPLKTSYTPKFGLSQNAMISTNGKTAVGKGLDRHSEEYSVYSIGDSWQVNKRSGMGDFTLSPDGELILTRNSGIVGKSLEQKSVTGREQRFTSLLYSAAGGPFYLSQPIVTVDARTGKLRNQGAPASPPQVLIYGEKQALAQLNTLKPIRAASSNGRSLPSLTLSKRVWFLPNQGRIIQVAQTLDELRCYALNLEKVLEQSQLDFLVVLSRPVSQVKAGVDFEYQIKAKSKSTKIQYSLDLAPKGMTISPTGKISWATSAGSEQQNKVVVSLRDDAGGEAFHTFDVEVVGAKGAAVARNDGQPAPKVPPITVSDFAGDVTEMTLPSSYSDMKVGGGGRYILLKMDSLQRIAIVDVCERKIVGYVPATDKDSTFAVGYDKVVVFDSTKGTMTRYNITDQTKELTAKTEFTGIVSHAAMGANSNGPILLRWSRGKSSYDKCTFEFIDLKTLKKKEVTWPSNTHMHESFQDPNVIRASLNGKKFAIGVLGLVKLQGNVANFRTFDRGLIPSADGKYFADDKAYDFHTQIDRTARRVYNRVLLPSATGNFYLKFATTDRFFNRDEKKSTVDTKIGVFGQSESVGDGPSLRVPNDRILDNLYAFIPNAKILVEAPQARNKLIYHRLDAEAEFAKSDQEYFYIASLPGPNVAAGDTFEYQIDVKTKSKPVQFNLASGPAGMKVDSSGKVTWKTDVSSEPENVIVVNVSGGKDKQILHAFELNVIGGKGPETVVAAPDADADMAPPITPAAIENESRNISFPVAFERIKVGGNGRYLCLHLRDIRKVAIVDVSLAKVTGYISLRSDEAEFAASKNKLVVVDSTNKRISRWNLVSRKMELEKKFTEVGRADRCVMGRDSSGPLLVRTTNNAVDRSGRVQKFHLFDLNTLEPLEVDQQTAGKLTQSIVRGKEDIFVSPNGKEFVIYNFGTIKIEDKGVRVLRNYSEDLSRPAGNGWHVRKNQIYSGGKAVATIPDAQYIIPALDGPFYISLPGVLDRFRGRTQRLPTTSIRPRFHILGETQPITSLERYTFSARFTPEQSMILIPGANVLAMTNQTRDTIEFKSLDVTKLMSNSDVDFLIVSSQPTERRLKLEQEFDYQIEVTSKNGGLKYSLDSSPEGMTVDSDGRITWAVPEDLKIASHEVIVSVKDSKNQEVFHKFNLFVPEVAVIAERARMKKRQAEQMKAMTEQNKLAIKEFKAKYEAAKLKSEEPPGLAEFEESPNEVRKWTDSTGEHQIEAKFVKVENRTDLMLIADDGRTRRIPLNRLSSKDVYAAVELELKRTEAADKAKKKTSEVKLDAQTQFEIYRDVNRMVEDFDKLDVEAWYGVVYHPDALKKKKESGELQKGLTEYNKTYLYSNLLKIDLTRARQNKDFLSVRTVSLKKIGDRWYVYLR